MVRHIGRLHKFGIGIQTAPGVEKTPDFWIPLLEGSSFQDKPEYKDNEGGYGNTVGISDTQIGFNKADGDMNGKIQLRSVGAEMTLLHGQAPTSVQRTTTGVFDHTWDMLTSTNATKLATLSKEEPNFSGKHKDVGINTWSLDTELGDFIKRTMNLMGGPEYSTTAATPAYIDDIEFMTDHMNVRLAAEGANDATIEAATPIKITGFGLNFNKNVELTQEYGSKDPSSASSKVIAIDGSIEAFYDDRMYYTLARANGNKGTSQAMRVSIKDANLIIGTSGSHNPEIRFTLSNIKFQLPEKTPDNNELVKQTIPFKAYVSMIDGKLLTTRVTNAYAGTAY